MRPFSTADATLAYPIASYGDTWPIGWVLAILGCALVGTIAFVELWLARATHADVTARCAAFLYFFLDALMATIMTAMVTEVSKRYVGRWRPNALARCQPQPGDGAVVIGAPASANPACTAPPSHKLTDAHYRWAARGWAGCGRLVSWPGLRLPQCLRPCRSIHPPCSPRAPPCPPPLLRRSFPSGHSSVAFALAVWTAAYLTWALNVRVRTSLHGGSGVLARLRADLGAAAGFLWTLALLGFAWAVAASRVYDFMHHPSDVIAGAFLGTVIAAFYVARSIARLPLVVRRAPAVAPLEAELKSAYMTEAH